MSQMSHEGTFPDRDREFFAFGIIRPAGAQTTAFFGGGVARRDWQARFIPPLIRRSSSTAIAVTHCLPRVRYDSDSGLFERVFRFQHAKDSATHRDYSRNAV